MINFVRKYRFEIFLFFLYLLLAAVWTRPLVFHLNSSIYGIRGDHFMQLWENWWQKKALLSGESLFFTPLVDAPLGFSYEGAAIQPVSLALNLLLTLLTNEVLALNILLLLSFPLAGLAIYALVRRLTGNRLAGALSGLIYAFSMYHFSHAWEHSSLVSIYWMPFYVWALVCFDQKPTVKRALVAAFLFAAVMLDDFYYGYFVAFFTVFFLLIRALQTFIAERRNYFSWRRLRLLFVFGASLFLVVLPFIFPVLKGVFVEAPEDPALAQAYVRPLHDLNWFAARPWHYILPSPHHPLWGEFSQKALDWIATKPPYFLTQPYAGREHNLYLGWTALLLGAIAVFWMIRRKRARIPQDQVLGEEDMVLSLRAQESRRWIVLFLFLAITMAIFSAPPYATINLHKIYFTSSTSSFRCFGPMPALGCWSSFVFRFWRGLV